MAVEGFTMSKISDFISEELNISIEKRAQLKSQIRSLQLDMEFVDKAKDKIIKQKDTTGDTFLSADNSDNFDDREILKLKEQKERIKALIEDKEKELEEISKRCDKIKDIFLTYNLQDKDLSEDNLWKNNSQESASLEDNVQNDNQQKSNLWGGDLQEGKGNSDWRTVTPLEISVQEMDRRRIAMEIHDTVVQNLTALTLKNDFIVKIINSDRQRAQLELKNCNSILRESIEELRNIIFDLRPMSLDILGFEDTFINFINRLSAKTGMIITYDYKADINHMDSMLLINLIRIIQELCYNSIKYSKGTKLEVKVLSDKKYVIIDVIDDGIGFDLDNNVNGFGLSMVRDRLSAYGGQLQTKRLAKGMQCRILVPIKEKKVD